MKTILILLVQLFTCYGVIAQFGPRIEISSELNFAKIVLAADINGDGFEDVISGSGNLGDGKIAWYENTDGLGGFGLQNIISIQQNSPQSILARDVDSDGDNDVLVAYWNESKIVWFKNVGGQGLLWEENIITTDLLFASSVYGCDLDGDDDIDVLSASTHDDKIAWYENIDGSGNFSSQNIISENADFASFVFASDIDNDGDFDVLSASSFDDKIAWYENIDGQGTFGSQQIINLNADYATSVFTADIDNDGDLDVLSSSSSDYKIAWYENIDGQGDFGQEQIIDSFAYSADLVFAADLDNDNDIDVLSAASASSKLVWYENINGQGDFSMEHIITLEVTSPTSVYASDIDNDGDIDVLSADTHDETYISWYKNSTTLDNSDFIKSNNALYPNPVENIIFIRSNKKVESIKIFNQTGQLVTTRTNVTEINTENLQSGLYLIQILFDDGKLESQKIIKE